MQSSDTCSASDSIDKITSKKSKNIEDQSKKWTGLGTFESVFTTVDWELGSAGLFMHDSCYVKLCRPKKLAQAKKCKEKQSQNVVSQDKSSFNSSTTLTNESFSSIHLNVLIVPVFFTIRQNVFGVLREQTKTVSLPNYTLFFHCEHGDLSNAIPFY